MGEKGISVDFIELNQMEVYCPGCETGVLLDVSVDRVSIPSICSSCREDLSDHIQTAMRSYKHFFQNARDSKVTLKFRIKDPE
jgi:hypothetical protein